MRVLTDNWCKLKECFKNWLLLFSHSVMCDSLWAHGLQHIRSPCPSSSPGACLNSRPLSQWCHPTISSSVVHLSSCPQFSPASGSFLTSWLFISGGRSIGASTSTSVLPNNIQGWFLLGLTGLTALHPRDSQKSSPIPQLKNTNSSVLRILYGL